MKTQCSTNMSEKRRWIPLSEFCERESIKIRTARTWMSNGKLKIKPKKSSHERVYVDWDAYYKEWRI
ncbi:hypothetical protein [Xenorhabdus cabanillasii]|uniref:Excisionase n=1 Tax=Xenorhabdus cabanillasii JM26 TaxID=1427517 RepID=W1IQY2_9GAMM|nr:hypothetical protein [Xenorhabdus cabanillasii]PHM76308.1 hypothetical protein Xcab_03219 [Xenorhabdus cabanillasii JM26]CDL79630.1 hypothetical protein XCR1_1190003 [Xenorhabdus cabanillasii JM26]